MFPAEHYSRMLFHHETDADGVCHFSNYFRICEETFFHMASDGALANQLFAIREASAQYMRPLRFRDRFEVKMDLMELRRSNFMIGFSIQIQSEPAARIQMRFVCIHPEKWEPVPLPEEIKTYLKEKVRQYDSNSNTFVIR